MMHSLFRLLHFSLRDQREHSSLTDFTQADLLSYGSRRWRRVQHLSNEFWRRWRQEYVQSLTHRSKWKKLHRDLRVNHIVLVKDDSCKRNHWPSARVAAVKPSRDGHIRSASLLLSSAVNGKQRTLDRPISTLVLLVPSS